MGAPEGHRTGPGVHAANGGQQVTVGPAASDGGREEPAKAAARYAERRTWRADLARAVRRHRRAPQPARTPAGGDRPAVLRGLVRGRDRGRDEDQPRGREESHLTGDGGLARSPRARYVTAASHPGYADEAEVRVMVERYV